MPESKYRTDFTRERLLEMDEPHDVIISVAMATYNGARYILEQLESIAGQTLPPDEIVICDDASTDNTVDLILSFSNKSDIKIILHINKINIGYSENFLKAASFTRGEYIAFADQDDIWLDKKLEQCYRAIKKSNASLCVHTATLIDGDGNIIGLMNQKIYRDQVFAPLNLEPWGMFAGFSQMIRRDLLSLLPSDQRGIDCNTFAKILPHDRWTYFLASNFGSIVALSEPLVRYRQHGSNTYGIVPKSLRQRFYIKVAEGPIRLGQFEDLALERLKLIKSNKIPIEDKLYLRAIRKWEKIWSHSMARRRLYVSPHFLGRLGHLISNIAAGVYAPYRLWGLGPKRLIEDVTLGLLGKRLVRIVEFFDPDKFRS